MYQRRPSYLQYLGSPDPNESEAEMCWWSTSGQLGITEISDRIVRNFVPCAHCKLFFHDSYRPFVYAFNNALQAQRTVTQIDRATPAFSSIRPKTNHRDSQYEIREDLPAQHESTQPLEEAMPKSPKPLNNAIQVSG